MFRNWGGGEKGKEGEKIDGRDVLLWPATNRRSRLTSLLRGVSLRPLGWQPFFFTQIIARKGMISYRAQPRTSKYFSFLKFD